MTVLLDINVILDVLLAREPWRSEADAIWDASRDGRLGALISAATLPTVFYVVRKQADRARAHLAVTSCVQSLEIAPIDRTAVEMATALPGADFEDNLQIACAALSRVDAIVTRDPKGFAGSPVPVLTPAELLAQIPKGDDA